VSGEQFKRLEGRMDTSIATVATNLFKHIKENEAYKEKLEFNLADLDAKVYMYMYMNVYIYEHMIYMHI
jgi:hypothetical protein